MKKCVIPVVMFLGVLLPALATAGEAEVRSALKELDPHAPIQSVKHSKVSGLYEVLIGADIYYVTGDGKYIISGDIYESRSRTNLTALARGQVYLQRVNAVGEGSMIIYEPRKVKQTLTVFTDVDCPYCRKFHKDLPQHLKKGIRIRYVMFPLQGLQASTYKKSVSVWCSDDRNKALDTAKS
ncbi:MAG: DsbC family protein, partial [Gammaproteobacteria bacterium]|nr:DsbC family protein [Gammaproteobacteria bacterium]